MDDRELARHLDAMRAGQSSTRWVAAVAVLVVGAVLVVRALRPARSTVPASRTRRWAAVAASTAVAAALVTTLVQAQHRVEVAAAGATDDVVAWVGRTESLRVTSAFRGCRNDVPAPHTRTCLSARAVDDRGTEHRVRFRWSGVPGDGAGVTVEVDRATPGE